MNYEQEIEKINKRLDNLQKAFIQAQRNQTTLVDNSDKRGMKQNDQIALDSESIFDIADMAGENSEANFDLADMVSDLEARVDALENK